VFVLTVALSMRLIPAMLSGGFSLSVESFFFKPAETAAPAAGYKA
jgi:hypothetical protein